MSQVNLDHHRVKTEKSVETGRADLLINGLRYVAMLLLLLCSWNAAMAGDRGTKSDKVTRKGADIFKHYCSVCHGDKGNGQSRARGSFAVPPRDYTTPEAAIELSRDRMIHSVTYGRPGTAMIAWGTELTAAEVEGVVDYIRATFMRLGDSSAPHARPSDKLMASRGGVLYMQACAMCHGDTGKRMTSGRMQPPPTDFTLPKAASELTNKRMIASITNGRPGTAMKSYGSEFSKADIEAMTEFIRAAFMSDAKPKK
ncbi:MAG: c-type cytochrome [Gallionella sp.]